MAVNCYTLHQVRQLWKNAKENYVGKLGEDGLPKVKDFEDLVRKLSVDAGTFDERGNQIAGPTPEDVARMLASPKGKIRAKTTQLYRQQSAQARALSDARAYVAGINQPSAYKALRLAAYLPQGIKVGAHTVALMGTHGWR